MIAQAIGLAGLALLGLPTSAQPSAASRGTVLTSPSPRTANPADDPAEWRDQRRVELRRHWDKLEGKPAPPLAPLSEWTNSEAVDWKDLRGKVVLIDYWATWCGPCRKGIPHLKELQKKFSEDGLVVLGIHSARGWEKMGALAKSSKIDYPLAADKRQVLGQTLGVQFLPSYFAVDRDGVMRVAGAERSQLDAIVEGLLSEPVPGAQSEPESAATGDSIWPRKVEKRLYGADLRGKRAPALEATEWLTSQPDLAGKVVLYDLWATWCAPCRNGIPKLNEYQKIFADDLVVISVSNEDADTVRSFAEKTHMGYSLAIDGGKLKRAIRAQAIPHVIVVSSDGIVRWQGVPHLFPDGLNKATLQRIIDGNRRLQSESDGGR